MYHEKPLWSQDAAGGRQTVDTGNRTDSRPDEDSRIRGMQRTCGFRSRHHHASSRVSDADRMPEDRLDLKPPDSGGRHVPREDIEMRPHAILALASVIVRPIAPKLQNSVAPRT